MCMTNCMPNAIMWVAHVAEQHMDEKYVLERILAPVVCNQPLRCGGYRLNDSVEKQDILATTMKRLRKMNDSSELSKMDFLVNEFQDRKKDNVEHPFSVRDFEQNINTRTCDRHLCQSCFAATYNMLKPNGQYRTSWSDARKAFCQTGEFYTFHSPIA